jgi:3-phenylpropionate/trans-cinnamate dioxygenase ferredoxin subunit
MGTFVKAASTGEFEGINKKKVSVQGQEIMLAKVGGNYYATANACPHMKGDLSAGTLEGTVITCPRHGSQFDVTDGHNVRWLKGQGLTTTVLKAFSSAKPVKSFKVRVEGDNIMVEV